MKRLLLVVLLALAALAANVEAAGATSDQPAKAFGVQAPAHPFSADAYAIATYISVAEFGCYLEDCDNGPRYFVGTASNGHYGTAHVTSFKLYHRLTLACLQNVYVHGVGLLDWQLC